MTPEELAKRLNAKQFKKQQRAWNKPIADVLLEAAIDEAPRSDKEGEHLADHLRPVISNTGRGIRIGADAPEFTQRLKWVVKGTPAHLITATNAQALAFEVGGALVFARSVQHPGTQPNDFLTRASEKAAPDVEAIMQEQAEAWLAQVAG